MFNKLKQKIKINIVRNVYKKHLVDTFDVDGTLFKIFDIKSSFPFTKDKRTVMYKNNEKVYSSSTIYLNTKNHFQPILPIAQKSFAIWAKDNCFNSALVLGCSGCAIPRFLALHYPNSKIIGVELSQKMIEIAHKYFLLNQIEKQFTLMQGDAIEFIRNEHLEKQDFILVDIFANGKIISEVLTTEFFSNLYNTASNNSIVIVNVLNENIDSIKEFCDNMKIPFTEKHLIKNGNAQVLCLTKSINHNTDNFKDNILKSKDFSLIF